MMKKNYINSFILSIFCFNVLFLVFSSGTNEFLKLFSSLLTIIGLVWLVYFYLQSLDSDNAYTSINNNLKINDINLQLSPDSQFLNLIDSSFALIKDLNSGFESAIYFFQPESDTYEVKSSSSDIFTNSFSSSTSFIEYFTKKKQSNYLISKR